MTFKRVGDYQGVKETTWPSKYKGTMFYASFANNFPFENFEWKITHKSKTLNFHFQKTKKHCIFDSCLIDRWETSNLQKGIFNINNYISNPLVSFVELKHEIESNTTFDLELFINNRASCKITDINFSGELLLKR